MCEIDGRQKPRVPQDCVYYLTLMRADIVYRFHAYLGSATLAFFVIHAAIGIKLGLSIA